MKTRLPKAADLDDRAVLQAVTEDARDRGTENLGACGWTLAVSYFPGFPEKVVLAKLSKLGRRGLIRGCDCGCRGDWTLTPAGKEAATPQA